MKRLLMVTFFLFSFISICTISELQAWDGGNVPGKCVDTAVTNCGGSSGGSHHYRREREPALTQEELQNQQDQQYNQRQRNIGLKYFNAGLNYENAGMWAEAEKEYFKATNGYIMDWQVCWHMSYVLEKQGKYEEALKWASSARARTFEISSRTFKDDRAAAYSQEGYLQFITGRYDLAKGSLEDVLKYDPNNSFARNILNQLIAIKNEQQDKKDKIRKEQQDKERDDRKNLMDELNKQAKKSDPVVQKRPESVGVIIGSPPPPKNKKSEADRQVLIKKKKIIINDLVKKVKSDQNAIRNLGLYDSRDPEKRARDFEDWANLSAKAKMDLEKEFLEAALQAAEVALSESIARGAGKVLKPIKSLNPVTVNKQIAWLQSKGVTDPYLFDAIRAVAKYPGKPELAKKLIERLHVTAEISIDPGSAFGSHYGEEKSHEVLNRLGLVLGIINPKYKLIMADLRVASASVYNNAARRVSEGHIESLNKLTENQLRQLNNLNKRLVQNVKQLNKEKKELARLTAGN